ncbi:hypothetical protein F4808DRAFT_432784 [Astrocystis sublimbata]|nr:hypothetical protein F4808DRAFT_432784 [Astrocystis sublimbata]
MSITLAISKSGLTRSRKQPKEIEESHSSNEVDTGKPSIVSLYSFASKILSFNTQGITKYRPYGNTEIAPKSGLNQGDETTSREIPRQTGTDPIGGQISSISVVEGLSSTSAEPVAPTDSREVTATESSLAETTDTKPVENNQHRTDEICARTNVLSGPTTETNPSTRAPNQHLAKPSQQDAQHVSHAALGKGSATAGGKLHVHKSSTPAKQLSPAQVSDTSIGSSSVSPKGGESARLARLKQNQYHIPRTKWERLKNITLAGPTTEKIENVEFSAANREKIRNFTQILVSTKGQIELFGKELPLCRSALVQVREGNSVPATYICIQGLKNAADITRIHAALSHERYKQLYSPLRLCYDTSDLVHVTFPDNEVSSPLPNSVSEADPGSSYEIDTSPEPAEMSASTHPLARELHMQETYQYLPLYRGETYCGGLCRTSVNGHSIVSTLGGLIEVNGRTYIMTCHHGFQKPHTESSSTPSDTSTGSEFVPSSQSPLVFCSEDLPGGPDEVDDTKVSKFESRLASLEFSDDTQNWTSIWDAEIAKIGQEWVLIPIGDDLILPNLTKGPSSDEASGSQAAIHYIDNIAEPRPGTVSSIITCSRTRYSGLVSTNTSFLFGAGMENMLEVWTVNLDGDEDLQKGDSGSWVLKTSDPLHYQALGSVVATSRGSAHFITLYDQFREIQDDFGVTASVSIAPVFRSLVQCAYTSERPDYFLDEAFSPQVLQQLNTGWYLPLIKAIGGARSNNANQVSGSNQWHEGRMRVLKGLFLHYGVALLDNIGDEGWIQKRGDELSGLQSSVFEEFVTRAKHPSGDETNRLNQEGNNIPSTTAHHTSTQVASEQGDTSQIAEQMPDIELLPVRCTGERKKAGTADRAFKRSMRFRAILLSLALLNLAIGLEATVLTTALPTIVMSLDVGYEYVWVLISPHLALLVIRSLASYIDTMVNVRTRVITTLGLFALGSGLSGGASNTAMLVSGRTIQALGIGSSYDLINALVLTLNPNAPKRYFGNVQVTFYIGISAGPVIGGALAQINWRWCFYLNLIVGTVALISVLLLLIIKTNQSLAESHYFPKSNPDFIGMILFQGSIVSLLLGLVRGGIVYPWKSVNIITPIVVGVAGLLCFCLYERVCKNLIVPGRFFQTRTSAAGFFLIFDTSLLLNWVIWMLPVYFQGIMGTSPLTSSLDLLPSSLLLGPGVVITLFFHKLIVRGNDRLLSYVGILPTIYCFRIEPPWFPSLWCSRGRNWRRRSHDRQRASSYLWCSPGRHYSHCRIQRPGQQFP